MTTQLRLDALHRRLRACRLCLDAGNDIVPGAVMTGGAAAQVMIIGQAPGVTEVDAKRPFNAGSGRRLFDWLGEAGWAEMPFRGGQYMTAVTKCFPGKPASGRGDRVPSPAEQALCRPYLNEEVALVAPRLIIPVGRLAITLFYPGRLRLKEIISTGLYLPPPVADFNMSAAQRHHHFDPELPAGGRWIVPLPHPSGASAWPNMAANRPLLTRAIALLSAIRVAWHL